MALPPFLSRPNKALVFAAAAFAFVAPAVAPSAPVAQTIDPASSLQTVIGFVRTYAATTGSREVIARWFNPICIQVTGLASDQAAAVKMRVEDVARSIGVEVQPAGCKRPDIEIGFATDPQATLNGVIKSNGRLLGDPTSGTKSKTTVTLPIQGWYETNGQDVAANDAGGLKALAAYRADDPRRLKTPVVYQYGAGQPTPSSNMGVGNYSGAYTNSAPTTGNGGRPSFWYRRQFLNALVIVDLQRTGSANLRLLSDYVAMLALSQPKSLGTCQALPSIIDLFACSDRAPPDGLTLADTAYLKALYAVDRKTLGIGHSALLNHVVDAMAPLLANPKVVAR